jgi:hypothetical protein
MKTGVYATSVVLLVAALALVAAASAAIIDLAGGAHVQIGGAGGDERAGWSVADAGDVSFGGAEEKSVGGDASCPQT